MNEKIYKLIKSMEMEDARVTPFKSAEDGSDYEVWEIIHGGERYALKRAKERELEIYTDLLKNEVASVPRLIARATEDGQEYFLMEYVEGEAVTRFDRETLTHAINALVCLQERFWGDTAHAQTGITLEVATEQRRSRGKYLNDSELEAVYAEFLEQFSTLPRTLCHDDLLPFNVITSDAGAKIVDWEYAGILPYPTPFARLIAHCEDTDGAFFYMSDSDREFAIDYYYETLVSRHGISYGDYRHSLDLFIFYEYCEWIMLGNKYADADMERFEQYTKKAKALVASRAKMK